MLSFLKMEVFLVSITYRSTEFEKKVLKKIKKLVKENPLISQKEMAERIGCSYQSVLRIAQKHNIRQSKGRVPENLAQIIADAPDKSYKDIAEEYGCTESAISCAAIRLGIRRRNSRTESKKIIALAKKELKKNPDIRTADLAEKLGVSYRNLSSKLYFSGIRRLPEREKYPEKKIKTYLKKHPETPMMEVARKFNIPYHLLLNLQESRPKKKSLIDKKKLVRFTEKKKPIKEIAEYFGCSVSAVMHMKKKIFSEPKERRRHHIVSWETIKKTVDAHPDLTIRELAEMLDISIATLSKKLNFHGMIRKQPRKINYDELKKDAVAGVLNFSQMAKKHGVTYGGVILALKKLGVYRPRRKYAKK